MFLRNPKFATVAIFIMAFSISGVMQIYATENLTEVKTIKIDIWPEYDKPMVLVMIDGRIAESIDLPIEVKLPVMEGGVVHMSCSITPGGKHIHESFKEEMHENSKYVTFVLRERHFHLEYYYNSFRDTPFREFDFIFKAPFNIGNAQVEIKEPLGSTGFILNPPSKFPMKDQSGVTIHSLSFGELKKGEEINISAEYSKGDLVPSNQRKNISSPTIDTYKLLTIILGSLLLLWLGYSAFRRSSTSTNVNRKRENKNKRRTRRHQVNHKSKKSHRINFCSQCGSEIIFPTKFCGVCGNKIQKVNSINTLK